MALFQRNAQTSAAVQYYTIGQTKSVLLVGLGNVGKQYDMTRHNVGFLCIDAFVQNRAEMSEWQEKKDLKCYLSKGQLGETHVIAIKPTTFMNLSGESVQKVSHYYKIAVDHTVVIHDELDIPFGGIRLRIGGSSAGHNGIKSITQVLGDECGRVRIGIGPKQPSEIDSAEFVLQHFTQTEQKQLPNLTQEVTAILTEYIYGGQLQNETRNFLV